MKRVGRKLKPQVQVSPSEAPQSQYSGSPAPQVSQASLYRQMFENNRTVELVINAATGKIVDANPAAAGFYGYTRETLQELSIAELAVMPDGQPLSPNELQVACCEGELQSYHRLASGDIRTVEVVTSYLSHEGQRLLYCIVSDMTERLQAAAALRFYHQQETFIDSISQRVRQSLNLQEVLQRAVSEVYRFLKVDRVMIYRYDVSGRCGAVVAEIGHPQYPSLEGWRVCITSSETGKSWQPTAEVEAIADISQAPLDPSLVELLQAFGTKAQMSIPIRQNEHIWGLLIAHQCEHHRQWQTWEIDLMKRLETQLGVAIQQAELYQQVQRLNADLESNAQERTAQLEQALDLEAVLKRITDKVRDSLDETQILQTMVNEIGSVLQVQCCDTSIYNHDRTAATILNEYAQPGFLSQEGKVLPFSEQPEIYQQLLRGYHFAFCHLHKPGLRGDAAIFVCPIFDEQSVLGDIRLFRTTGATFNHLEERLVQQVANQCAIAIRQSRLYQAAQAQVEELERLNQLKDDFLSTVSHELRTPLSSIKLATQLLTISLQQLGLPLTDETPPDPAVKKVQQCLSILEMECNREVQLISDMLTLLHLEAGTQPFVPSVVDLNHWLPQVVETFEDQASQRQQLLQVDIAPPLPTTVTDLFMFDHVIGELLTNACKFTPAGETVTLSATVVPLEPKTSERSPTGHNSDRLPAATDAAIQITITNTGVEIPPSEQNKVFQQFYRIPSNDPWKHGGTGLGLALVKRMTERLEGSIRVESANSQTSFILKLPVRPTIS